MKLAKKLLAVSIALTLVFAFASCNKKNDDAGYTVKVAYGTALCHAPLHIAIEKGFFEQEGLAFEAVPLDTASTLDGAASGTVDAGFGLIGKFAQPLENGLGINITAGIHLGCIKIVVAGDSAINSVADLKGKKIGVASLTDSPAIIAKRALAGAGLKVTPGEEEFELIVFPAADLLGALQNGAVDAYAAMDPAVSVAIRDANLKTLVDTATDAPFKDEFCCATFVTDSLANDHPDLAEKYTQAIIKAAKWIEDNSEEAAKIQIEKQYVTGDEALNAALLKSYSYGKASVDGGRTSLEVTLKELQAIGTLKAETDVDKLAEDSFFKKK